MKPIMDLEQAQAFLFDLDGTIIDTIEDLCDGVNYSLAHHGLPLISVEECVAYVGNGSRLTIERAMHQKHMELFQSVYDVYHDYYMTHFDLKSHAYPGMKEFLSKAKEKGIRLFVYTNKPHDITVKMIEEIYGNDCFDLVLGVKEGNKTKPCPDAFQKEATDFRLDYSRCVYFGDSVTDVETAHNLGCGTMISVLYGYQTKEKILSLGIQPDLFVEHSTDLVALFKA